MSWWKGFDQMSLYCIFIRISDLYLLFHITVNPRRSVDSLVVINDFLDLNRISVYISPNIENLWSVICLVFSTIAVIFFFKVIIPLETCIFSIGVCFKHSVIIWFVLYKATSTHLACVNCCHIIQEYSPPKQQRSRSYICKCIELIRCFISVNFLSRCFFIFYLIFKFYLFFYLIILCCNFFPVFSQCILYVKTQIIFTPKYFGLFTYAIFFPLLVYVQSSLFLSIFRIVCKNCILLRFGYIRFCS